jgi:SpoVK/Ycf46/Vps4 family AAA+-type ATPase
MATMTDDLRGVAPGARRINTDTDPEELVLPAESTRRLGWIADWLVQPPPVLAEWGLRRYFDGGFRALFRGRAGTGKTMAATALGRSTERPVFHVDLSAVVSKYIGETEKNLRQIFAAAGEENAILLFDEADALLGKRSEVRDAHDRYANVEIGYLLRWLEPFEGLAILTSNAAAHIGDDILSRIDVIVEFPMPDEAAREELWRKILGNLKLPQGDDLDVRFLAKQQELTGAEILRCARIAALLAATAGRTLDMELLQFAAAERLAMRGASAAK